MFKVAVAGSGYIAQNHFAALKKIEDILDNGRFSPLNFVDKKMAEDELARLKG